MNQEVPDTLRRLFEKVVEWYTLLFSQFGRYLLRGDLVRRVGEFTDESLPKFGVYAVGLQIFVHDGQLLKLFKRLLKAIPRFFLIVHHELHHFLSQRGTGEG